MPFRIFTLISSLKLPILRLRLTRGKPGRCCANDSQHVSERSWCWLVTVREPGDRALSPALLRASSGNPLFNTLCYSIQPRQSVILCWRTELTSPRHPALEIAAAQEELGFTWQVPSIFRDRNEDSRCTAV